MFEPPAFESAVERSIREATERGEFDDLPGKGRPIPGAGQIDDPLWWVRGWLRRQRHLDSLQEARSEVERRLGAIWILPDERRVREVVDEINAALPDELEHLDGDEVVSTWRSMAAARRRTLS